MPGPSITVNTYSDSLTGHTNVTFRDANGNHVGTWGANIDIGHSSMPGSLGGIYAESPARTPSYTHKIILPDGAFERALDFARESARITTNGGGDYSPFLVNCYDFVQSVLRKAEIYQPAFMFMEPGSLVHRYGEIISFLKLSDGEFDGHMHMMTNDPQYQPITAFQMRGVLEFIEAQKIETPDEIIIKNRIMRIEYETWVSPIAIDIDGDGFRIIDLKDSTSAFDFHGQGEEMRSAWLDESDGFLCHDTNSDGIINNINELFGGRSIGDGFSKLANFDTNKDSFVNSQDVKFGDLSVWRDIDGDGNTDEGELATLESLGISSLSLSTTRPNKRIGDAIVTELSTADVNGNTVDLADLHFRGGGLVKIAGSRSYDDQMYVFDDASTILATNTVIRSDTYNFPILQWHNPTAEDLNYLKAYADTASLFLC